MTGRQEAQPDNPELVTRLRLLKVIAESMHWLAASLPPALSATEMLCALQLLRTCNSTLSTPLESALLAKKLGVSERQARTYVRSLERHRLLKRVRSGRETFLDLTPLFDAVWSTRSTPPLPSSRSECRTAPRPCPFVTCRYHLYLDVNSKTGTIKINFPDKDVSELPFSCALDIAEDGELTFEQIGEVMNVTRERIRQIISDILHNMEKAIMGEVQPGDRLRDNE